MRSGLKTPTYVTALGVRDWSGTWDDDYEGTIQFALLAEPDQKQIETFFTPDFLAHFPRDARVSRRGGADGTRGVPG